MAKAPPISTAINLACELDGRPGPIAPGSSAAGAVARSLAARQRRAAGTSATLAAGLSSLDTHSVLFHTRTNNTAPLSLGCC